MDTTLDIKNIISQALDQSLSYQEYKELTLKLIDEGKSTGHTQSEALLDFSILNSKRVKRLDKTTKLANEAIATAANITKNQTWILLTESWCGDAAQTTPVINKIAESSDKIDFKIALRDDNQDLMNQFLTNGGQAIPKLIITDTETGEVLGDWGPRPSVATKMVNDYKKEHGGLDAEFKKDLQVWYNKNKGVNTQDDIIALLNKISQ